MSKSINVFKGRKAKDEITYTESPLEADFCYHLEYDKRVKSYQSQPACINYYFEEKIRTYYPDFEVFFTDDTSAYYEVKFEADIKRIPNFLEKKDAIKKAALDQGRGFVVITEDSIRKFPLFENLINLWSTSNVEIDKDFLSYLIKFLDKNKQAKIQDLLLASSSDYEFEQVYRLIFDGKLIAPLKEELLSKSSVVRHSGEPYGNYL